MNMTIFHWENSLISMAREALESHTLEHRAPLTDGFLLEKAYHHCQEITRANSRTFFIASALLPPEKRHAIRALYAFCRVSDDLVDRADRDAGKSLEAWRQKAVYSHPAENDLVTLAWRDTCLGYQIPWLYVDQLLHGVGLDLKKSTYDTFTDLATYCYGVACTVGLMSMHIIGYTGAEAIPYAIRLGVALQLTNILRDVGEDLRAGRVYLPREELEAFGLNHQTLASGRVDERWRAFMRFQINRNRQLYASAMPGISLLAPDGRFAIAAAAKLYQAILEDIEAHDYNVFSRRAYVSGWGKLRRLPGIWRQTASFT